MLRHGHDPDHYTSIVRISPFNLPDERRRYVVIKAYFDGSWQDARTLTLVGFSGSADGWSAFLPQWRRVLDENSIEHWHSTDAMQCAGSYKKVVLGWDAARAVAVRDSLLRVIMRCGSYRLPVEERLRGFAATVYLADYHRV